MYFERLLFLFLYYRFGIGNGHIAWTGHTMIPGDTGNISSHHHISFISKVTVLSYPIKSIKTQVFHHKTIHYVFSLSLSLHKSAPCSPPLTDLALNHLPCTSNLPPLSQTLKTYIMTPRHLLTLNMLDHAHTHTLEPAWDDRGYGAEEGEVAFCAALVEDTVAVVVDVVVDAHFVGLTDLRI